MNRSVSRGDTVAATAAANLMKGKSRIMNRKLKVLSLALAAVFAFGAVSAVGASAAEFRSEIEKTFIFGEQTTENVFATKAGNIKCKKATFDSLAAQTGKEKAAKNFATDMITVHPKYTECTAFGQASSVETTMASPFTSTDYTLFSTTPEVRVVSTVTEGGSIEDPGTSQITVIVPSGNCSLQIKAQKPGTPTVEYKNEGAGAARSVLVTSKVEKISYTVTGPGTICGTPGNYEDGKLTGSVLLKGFSDKGHTAQTGFWRL
jgi:hypothetical protein